MEPAAAASTSKVSHPTTAAGSCGPTRSRRKGPPVWRSSPRISRRSIATSAVPGRGANSTSANSTSRGELRRRRGRGGKRRLRGHPLVLGSLTTLSCIKSSALSQRTDGTPQRWYPLFAVFGQELEDLGGTKPESKEPIKSIPCGKPSGPLCDNAIRRLALNAASSNPPTKARASPAARSKQVHLVSTRLSHRPASPSARTRRRRIEVQLGGFALH